jgi:hypothetical protein
MNEKNIKKLIDEEMKKYRKNYCIIYFSNPFKYPIVIEIKNGEIKND